MNKSIWYIFIFGVLGIFILMMAMCMGLTGLSTSDVGNRVKLAEGVRAQFKFENASAGVVPDGNKMVLRVSYQAPTSKSFDVSAQNKEMEAVATYAAATYAGSDKKLIDEIRVTRSEVKGRGCWQRTDVTHFTKANPFPQTGPFGPRSP